MRHVKQIMSMPIGVDIPGCDDEAVFKAVFDRLRQIDERFSTYKPESEVSRFARSVLAKKDLSEELKDVIKACEEAKKATDGYFSAWAGGQFQPSGYVKGWAIAEAGKVIERYAYGTYCIGAGGDILAKSDGDKVWNIGIQDPKDKQKILNRLSITNGAVATSGNYERGAHIINPKTKKTADYWASVTITGPDIITADVLATAAFAAGKNASNLLKEHKSYQAILIPKS